jgi:hypothetical protein
VGENAGEPDTFEVREDDLASAQPERAEIVNYLREGGLVAILRSNLAGGKQQPKAWLAFDPRGALTHTFTAERGVIGGAPVPFFALHENHIFTPKVGEVIDFVMRFGLTRSDAEDIVRSVGATP